MTRIVTQRDAERDNRLLREFAASGISVACANTFLNPVAGNSGTGGSVFQPAAGLGAARRQGFLATAGLIYRQEGLSGFTRGWQQLMSRDGSGKDLHVGQKLAAGSISGCIGAVLTTPMELVKTRLQAPSANTRSVNDVLRNVISQHGVSGLWRGATPSVMRLILLNSSMVATYDEVKGHISRFTQWGPGIKITLASSMVAGVVTTTVINPADVIRAYMQTGRGSSVIQVAKNILAKEGFAGFGKGWTAAYARTGPQTLIIFTVSEFVRPLFGLNAIGNSG
eukprot:gene1449-1791_t